MKWIFMPILIIGLVAAAFLLPLQNTLKVLLLNDEIEEASGITFVQQTNSLFVVDDEGMLYEMNLEGTMLRSVYLGDYDLEGITFNETSSLLMLAAEGVDAVLVVSIDALAVKDFAPVRRNYRGVERLHPDESHGLEGIVWHNNSLFVVNQSYNIDPADTFDQSAILEIVRGAQKYRIATLMLPPIPDMAGIAVYNNQFYILSDDNDTITVYDPATQTIIDQFPTPVEGEQEGITFDDGGNMYLAVEEQGVFKVEM